MANVHAVMQAGQQAHPAILARPTAPSSRRPASAPGPIPGAVVPLPGAADVLQRIGRPIQAQRGTAVLETGDANTHVYKVTDGILRVVRILPDGRRHIANFLKPGDFFGFSEATEHDCSVEAITDCALTRYPRKDFDAVIESDPAAGRQLFRLMCRQLEASNRMLLLLGRKTAVERLASFLLSFASGSQKRGMQVFLPMSRGDIADHLGLTIETVSRTISKFRQQRWISLVDSHTILITAPETLEDLAAD